MRNEKQEKQEKQEKGQHNEKGEKHEKGEFGYVGFLIAGLVVVLIGVFAYLAETRVLTGPMGSALTLLAIGLAIIVVGVYVAMMARKRNPSAHTA
jgi:xanthine/uracil permease